MKVGDLVRIKTLDEESIHNFFPSIGVIIDTYELEVYPQYEVRIGHDRGWFDSIELEVISEGR